tara:strand:- start:212 stop:403 length:192 start_codon:yes stop_codon:yes gene_type:complete
MVSGDDFRKDMDRLLKRRKILKEQRNSIISNYIKYMDDDGLSAILEQELRTTSAFEKRIKKMG